LEDYYELLNPILLAIVVATLLGNLYASEVPPLSSVLLNPLHRDVILSGNKEAVKLAHDEAHELIKGLRSFIQGRYEETIHYYEAALKLTPLK